MNTRIKSFRAYVQNLNHAGVRSTYIYQYVANSLRQTKGQPVQIQRAKAFAYILDHVKQVVLPYELITGSMLGMVPLYTGKHISKKEQEEMADAVIDKYLYEKKIVKISVKRRNLKKGTSKVLMKISRVEKHAGH